jgi:hypothetical protein
MDAKRHRAHGFKLQFGKLISWDFAAANLG